MNLTGTIAVGNMDIKLDMRCHCTSESVIYVALCKNCGDNDGNYYFGQTRNSLQVRNRGHRAAFKIENNEYEKSSLSMHTFEKHIDNFEKGLNNFDFGIVKKTSPCSLDKWEDYFIWCTNADFKGLNRYKVCA